MPEQSSDVIHKATFAGGCFWCMQPSFDNAEGVIDATVGYTGGTAETASYAQITSKTTKHVEAIQIVYDPGVISYAELLDIYWQNIDPTDSGGQFADRGASYRPVVFYEGEGQKAVAEKSKASLDYSGKFAGSIAVAIEPAQPFYAAEEYHQDYYKKNEAHYKKYKLSSGRQPFLEKIWGKK